MAEAVITVATEQAVRPLVDSISTQLGYIWNYKTNFDNLEKQVQKLQERRDMVQHAVEEAKRNGEEIERQVVNWLDSVNKMIDEATEIVDENKQANMKCFKRLCPDLKKRYQHSKKAAGKAEDVVRLREDGKFDRVSYRTPPKETWHPSNKLYEDFESRRSTVENILNALRNPDTNMVGVYGMGGVGKTTLVREVGKQAEEQRLFVAVVFVEVSEKPDTRKIQGEIADKLGLEFREETESGRARKLCERLKKESTILLILDNIWKGLDMDLVGIPFGNEHPGCKLLLTARSINVLSNDMNSSKNFSIGNLNEMEAWDLFKMAAGACIEQHNLQSLAFEVAKRCGGLPIAIVTIAKALKDKQEHAWRNALGELKRPSSENLEGSVTAEAYSCIHLSYNHLETDELKSTFLLCSTMGFTSEASIEDLLRYGMGLNIFRTVRTMEEARDRVNTLVQKLKDCSLLLDTPPNGGRLSIHDVVRDVGRSIAFKDHNQFTVIDGIIPREWKEKNILKSCTSIYLHDITELLNKELDCPLLKFLYMEGRNEYSKIPDNFFIGMVNLRVLHLINMEQSPLPTSLRCLVNLRTLCLNCSWLRDMGFIVDMKDLEILVLSCGRIEQLPVEIGQLTQLKVLDLFECCLEVIPPNIISRLTKLEELYMSYEFDMLWHVEGVDNESKNVSLDELKHLSQLTTLHIHISDSKIVPKGLFSHKLQRYKIYIGVPIWELWEFYSPYKTPRLLKLKYDDVNLCVEDGVVKQLKGIEDLTLVGKQGVKNVLHELDRDGFPQLKHFDVEDNPDLVYLVDFSKQSEPCVAFPHLETLSLSDLNSLKKVCYGQLTHNSFCQLRTIEVKRCVKLKNTFSSSDSRHLSQLKDIEVGDCMNMEEIFTLGRENEVIVLDQLHSLSLKKLPKLKSFCYEEEVASTSNQERQILDTPMPLFDRKVKFRNLKTLKLDTINLKYVFSSSILGSFVQLQDLDIQNCKVLEEIIRIDDLEDNVELSSLKSLQIDTCFEVKAFIFNDKVSFPNLEEIQISNMKNLEMIWHNQFTEDSMNAQNCQKLCKVEVDNCQNLKNLFPPSIAMNLFQLKDLYVKRCGIEEVVAKEGADDIAARTFVFPQLTYLKLEDLQELKCFYPDIHTVEWPVLKKLDVIDCDKIDQLFALQLFTFQENTSKDQLDISIQPLPLVKKVFYNLEELRLDGNNIRMICKAPFSEILFPKLKLLTIQGDKSTDLPFEIFQRSRNLERLSLLECSGYKEIFWCEETEKYIQIKDLSVSGLENLKQIWKQDCKMDAILQNLENLDVENCNSLVTLIPPSACFQNLTILTVSSCDGLLNLVSSSTAKSLVRLTKMKIMSCDMITEVVADNEGRTENHDICFSKLKSLELFCLSRLTSFSSSNYTFNFSSLENLTVRRCPKMKIFTAGVVITPMLREINLDNERYYCEGDVNTTMQQIQENLVLSGEELSLSERQVKMILQKFPEHQFSKLKSLVVVDDETALSFDMPQELSKLRSFCREEEVASTSDQERQIHDIPRPLFDRKVKFHNLKTLKLYAINSKYVFSSSTLGSFVQLQDLDIQNCKVLEEIIRIDDLEYNVELSSLKSLKIETCSEVKTFIFNDKVSFPNLEEIWISNMKNLEMIWHNQLTHDSMNAQHCQKLCKVEVNNCQNLKNLFPPSIAGNLFQLKDLYVNGCGIEEVVAKEGADDAATRAFVFPQLTYLKLKDLRELKCFYPGIHTVEWPVLKKLVVIGCDKIDQLFALQLFTFQENTLKDRLDISIQPLSLVKKVCCNLEKLMLDRNNIRMICKAPFSEILFPKLKLLTIQGDKSTDLPFEIFQRSRNLERLSLLECSGYKEIFWCEEAEKYIQIKDLSVSGLENLKQIWKQDCKMDAILQNLENLDVENCNSLVTLIPPSACFQNLTILTVSSCERLLNLVSSSTAKSLVQLTKMTIKFCDMITEVVADNGGRTEDHDICFSKLKSLELVYLSRLTTFSSSNYIFNFPSLENLSVTWCPKMKIFTAGVVITPMLREIQMDWKGYYCEGDINTTMQQIQENLVLSGERLSLSVREVKIILQKFPQHQFSELKHLVVFDDESTVLSFAMLQRFHNLKNLKLTDCSYKEIFSCEEVEKYAGTLVQLKSLDLDKLDDLEQLWKEDSKLDLILQNLKTLNVNECNSLITLMPASASFQNLKDLTVWRCKGLISLVSSSTAKTLVQLEYMRIDDCDVMTEIVANEDVKEDNIVFSKLKRLLLVDLSSLTSFCSANYTVNFPSLEYLYLSKCSKMKLFSSGVLHTPMLQQIKLGYQKNIWEGDLNTTVQQIYEELNPNSDGAGPSTQYLE